MLTAAYLTFFGSGQVSSQPHNPQPISATAVSIGAGLRLGLDIEFAEDMDAFSTDVDFSNFVVTVNGSPEPMTLFQWTTFTTMRIKTDHIRVALDEICVRLQYVDPAVRNEDGVLVLGFPEICGIWPLALGPEVPDFVGPPVK